MGIKTMKGGNDPEGATVGKEKEWTCDRDARGWDGAQSTRESDEVEGSKIARERS
jgi:hypothetical protein